MKLAKTAFFALTLSLTTPSDPARALAATDSMSVMLPIEQAIFSPLPQGGPFIAAGLSLAVNGAGQFYNHQSFKGWWCLAPVLAFPGAWLLDVGLGGGAFRMADALFIMGTKIYSAWDAYQEADKAAKK